MINAFLLGFICATSFVAALFFLHFWRGTRDPLFLAFAAAFGIEGTNRFAFVFFPDPAEGTTAAYWIRFFAFLLIVAAIAARNRTHEA